MLNDVMLNDVNNPIMLDVIMLNVVVLSVMAPMEHLSREDMPGFLGKFVNYSCKKFYDIGPWWFWHCLPESGY